MMKRILICVFCLISGLQTFAQETIELTGEWEYSVGDSTQYNDYAVLPGTVQVDGSVWFRKSVYVPQSWEKKRVFLFLEYPHHETTVYVNGEKILHQVSLSTPHKCDVTRWLKAGQRNTIVICVYGSGIAGRMELQARPQDGYIKDVRLRPLLELGVVDVSMEIGVLHPSSLMYDDLVLGVIVAPDNPDAPASTRYYQVTGEKLHFTVPIGKEVLLWDVFLPQLYQIGFVFGDDYYETSFGMREVKMVEQQLTINDRPIWLRGTVESDYFSETDNPPMTVEEWKSIFTKYKDYGLNFVCFRSYCPPEAAFVAADKVGLYLQVEVSSWSGQNNDEYLIEESKRIIDTFGHHPSLMMLTVNSESAGGWEEAMKKYDNTKVYNLKVPTIAKGELNDYKQKIEENMRTKDCVGFVLPSFDDVSKRMEANDWMEFCSPVVALAKLPKTDYSNKDTLIAPVEIYNAMYGSLLKVRNSYYLTDVDQHVVGGGLLSGGDIPIGKNIDIGTVNCPLTGFNEPTKLTLTVVIAGKLKNHWDFWVHPEKESQTTEVQEEVP